MQSGTCTQVQSGVCLTALVVFKEECIMPHAVSRVMVRTCVQGVIGRPWLATLLMMHRASPCSARVYNVVMSYMVTQTSQYLTSASLCCTLLRLTDILYAWPSDILNTAVMQSRRFTVTHSSVLNHAGCSNACSENETLDHNRSSLVFVARL